MLYIQWKSTLQQMWIYKELYLHKGQRLTFSSPFDDNGEWNIVDWDVQQYTTNPLWTQVLWISFLEYYKSVSISHHLECMPYSTQCRSVPSWISLLLREIYFNRGNTCIYKNLLFLLFCRRKFNTSLKFKENVSRYDHLLLVFFLSNLQIL